MRMSELNEVLLQYSLCVCVCVCVSPQSAGAITDLYRLLKAAIDSSLNFLSFQLVVFSKTASFGS